MKNLLKIYFCICACITLTACANGNVRCSNNQDCAHTGTPSACRTDATANGGVCEPRCNSEADCTDGASCIGGDFVPNGLKVCDGGDV